MANSTSSSPPTSIPSDIVDALTGLAKHRRESLRCALSAIEDLNNEVNDTIRTFLMRHSGIDPEAALLVVCGIYAEFPFFTADQGADAFPSFSAKIHDTLRSIALDMTPVQLGRLPYGEYLQTDHWRYVRDRALDRAGHHCQLCGSESGLQVHHNSYENRGDERDEDLLVLCGPCHQHFHDKLKVQR